MIDANNLIIKEQIKKKKQDQEIKRKDLKSLLNRDKVDDLELDILMNDIDVHEGE